MGLGENLARCYKSATCRGGKAVDILHVAVLALVQGVTEFLPVGSSADLAAVPPLAGWLNRGSAIDLAVHLGVLGAVSAYLWRDLWAMAVGVFRYFAGRRGAAAGARLAKPAQEAFWGGYSGYFEDTEGHLWEAVHAPFFELNAQGGLVLPAPK